MPGPGTRTALTAVARMSFVRTEGWIRSAAITPALTIAKCSSQIDFMDPENNYAGPLPEGKDESFLKIIWLFVAFCPTAAGIACLHIKQPGEWLIPFLLFLNLGSSIAAAVGLVRGMKSAGVQVLVGFLLVPFFFVL